MQIRIKTHAFIRASQKRGKQMAPRGKGKDLSYQAFYNLINPYLIQEMRYKLPYDYDN
jgi:hypothetical protein